MTVGSIIHHRQDSLLVNSSIREVLHYLGYSQAEILNKELSEFDPALISQIKSSISEMQKIIKPQSVYGMFDLQITQSETSENLFKIQFADVCIESKDLARNLNRCSKIIIFASTIGPQVDLLIKKSTVTNSANGVIMQACGAMFIESYVDNLNKLIQTEAMQTGLKAHPRFSPGYGDVDLSVQKDFFRILPCTQRLGLTLMDSCIMAPEKSVTAFIGLESFF